MNAIKRRSHTLIVGSAQLAYTVMICACASMEENRMKAKSQNITPKKSDLSPPKQREERRRKKSAVRAIGRASQACLRV